MTAELGLLAAALALCLAVLQGILPLCGVWRGRAAWIDSAGNLAAAQFAFLGVALACLAAQFAANDFSVLYVAGNSNTSLPLFYRLAAVWGGHEGSLLLWAFMLAGWGAAAALFSRQMPPLMRARVLAVLGLISAGFLMFTLLTSNPFARIFPPPQEGRDLNPLLQDPGLIFHPPMLYMGYAGFSVTFAFAAAALMAGRMDSAWAKWARPWTLAAWVFLTAGITLGSWWAYYELGWGGWWFWDPVENASFMPWLAGTALLHSLAGSDARGAFKPWTALLAVLTFSLCLLGTFLVRSGVLTSVHAFASDPARGVFILIFLCAVVGGALGLYARRAQTLSAGGARFSAVSREGGILINNIFLTAAAFSVLLGTLYPLILEAMGFGKISVGPPYFNIVIAPLVAIPAALSAAGALSRWKRDQAARLARKLRPAFFAAAAAAFLPLLAEGEYEWKAAAGLALAFWILFGVISAAAARRKTWRQAGGSFWGMLAAHAGLAVFAAGVTLANTYEAERDMRLALNEPQTLDGRVFQLEKIYETQGANYAATVAEVRVFENGRETAVLRPEKRRYFSMPDNPMSEAGIAPGWDGDIYASLGAPLGGGAWSARLQIKPFIRLVWGGALLMALGGLLAALDRRYRRA
ncbi:MAG: heme lyase CcmF/NrfE family subunit [Gammaproteobacteria bacterium]